MRFCKYTSGCLAALGLSLASMNSIAATASPGPLSPGGPDVFGSSVFVDPSPGFNTFDLAAKRSARAKNEPLFHVGGAKVTGKFLEGASAMDGRFSGNFGGDIILTAVHSSVTPYFPAVTTKLQPNKPDGAYSGTKPTMAVPVPAAAVLFGSALLAFAGFATRRRLS